MGKYSQKEGTARHCAYKNKYLMTIVSILISCIFFCTSGCALSDEKADSRQHEEIKEDENIFSSFYGGDNDIYFEDIDEIIKYTEEAGCNTLTIPIAWGFVEQKKGEYLFDRYEEILDKVIASGISVIIVLDTGGRPLIYNNEIVDWSIPEWAREEFCNDLSVNFNGEIVPAFDYCSVDHISTLNEFYNRTLDWLSEKYKKHILGVSPGIMKEFEIKYNQAGFLWEGYTDNARQMWQDYLLDKYGTIDEINKKFGTNYSIVDEVRLPIVNYNESITHPHSTQEYADFMDYRENVIVKYVSGFTDIIKKKGFQTIGYFGQYMFPLDAIYATGVISKCTSLFDIAVIDYNFFDGYKEQYNSDIPAFLTNLTSNLGYEKVVTGVYFERVSLDGKQEFVDSICENIKTDGHSSGIEIGSVISNSKKKIYFKVPSKQNSPQNNIAVFTSELNFYNTHGEYEEYQNYLLDSVVELYHILQFELGISVDVISDKNAINDELGKYDLIILPCQIFVDDDVLKKFVDYVQGGGRIIQDFRFGEYNAAGSELKGGELFGIKTQEAVGGDIRIKGDSQSYKLSQIYDVIPTAYRYSMGDGSNTLTRYSDDTITVVYKNTMTWGFQPQLQYKINKNSSYRQYIKMTIDYMLDEKNFHSS